MKNVPSNVKEKYEILGVIGEGSYGVVLKARKKDTNTVVAIKHFKQAPGYCTDLDVIERELKILQSLRFENVVELIEWFRDKKQCFLVFEYVEWNMLQVLQEHPDGLPLEQVRHLSYQLFSAIHWCHTREIIHRDIKPENLLISKKFILKLCDFGFARFCNAQTVADYYTDYVATRWYRSPELLIGSAYGKPVDVWACGCIMAELTTGQALFAGESDIDQLYRIQKSLGPLPAKYMEAMRTNPKFEGLKFPTIHHLDTLERRFGHFFPPDIMHLFKGTLRLFAADRLTAEAAMQHEAFVYLHQKQQQQQQRFPRQHRSKTVLGTVATPQPQFDQVNEIAHFAIPFTDSRLSKWYDENGEVQIRRRSPPLTINGGGDIATTDISFTGSSSIIQSQQIRQRSNTQPIDRLSGNTATSSHRHRHHHHQPKMLTAQSRTQSSSSDERLQPPPAATSPISSNDSSDDDDPNSILSHHSRLRRKYVKIQQPPPAPSTPGPSSLSRQQSLRDQAPTPASPTLKQHASNGVSLRPKHQHQSMNLAQVSSKDKKFKRFSFDTVENRWHQHQSASTSQGTPESNIYRSALAIVPSLNANVYGVQINTNNNPHYNSSSSSSSFKQQQQQQREETNVDVPQRPKTREWNRDLIRSRTIDCHPPTIPTPIVETTPVFQRTSSRQTVFAQHQIVPDPMDQADIDTTVSTTYSTSRSLEQQQSSKYPWSSEQQRRPVYGSDSHLMNSSGMGSSLGRPFYSPTKGDYAHVSRFGMAPQRDASHDLIRSAKLLASKHTGALPKTPIDSNRRVQPSSNLFGVYPYARTAILHVANAILPTGQQQQQQQRQPSFRLPSTKSRHHDR